MSELVNSLKKKLVTLIAEHTPKCHDVTRLVSQSMESPLPWRTRLSLRFHYLICVWCRRYRDQLGLVRTALRSNPEQDAKKVDGGLSPHARTRLKKALRPPAP